MNAPRTSNSHNFFHRFRSRTNRSANALSKASKGSDIRQRNCSSRSKFLASHLLMNGPYNESTNQPRTYKVYTYVQLPNTYIIQFQSQLHTLHTKLLKIIRLLGQIRIRYLRNITCSILIRRIDSSA